MDTTNLPTDDILEVLHCLCLNPGDNIIDPINQVSLLDSIDHFQLIDYLGFTTQFRVK